MVSFKPDPNKSNRVDGVGGHPPGRIPSQPPTNTPVQHPVLSQQAFAQSSSRASNSPPPITFGYPGQPTQQIHPIQHAPPPPRIVVNHPQPYQPGPGPTQPLPHHLPQPIQNHMVVQHYAAPQPQPPSRAVSHHVPQPVPVQVHPQGHPVPQPVPVQVQPTHIAPPPAPPPTPGPPQHHVNETVVQQYQPPPNIQVSQPQANPAVYHPTPQPPPAPTNPANANYYQPQGIQSYEYQQG